MVDIGAASPPLAAARGGSDARAMEGKTRMDVAQADETALADYEAFCRDGVHGPCQHPVWVRAWVAETGADAVIVTVRRDGVPVLKLALEVVAKGPFRIARFAGGNHANGNFAAVANGVATPLSHADGAGIAAALRKARPDIDLVLLSRQNPHFEGVENALSGLATMQSPNVSLAVDLDGGFEAVLARHNAPRKRKKFKYQFNRFKQAGGHALIEARTPDEVERLISTFFELKGKSLLSKGIADAFAPAEIRAFFRALFRDALAEREPPFLLHGVEVGGRIVAINGLSVTKESVICEFGTYCSADPKSSPGYFIDHTNIQQACERGKKIYDFSVGDEDYKRSWCDIETWQFETLLPLSVKGHALSLYERARATVVHAVKSNHALWAFAKRLRARLAGSKRAAGES